MWTYNYSDELYHHGVKGMKWGVRNERKEEYKDVRKSLRDAHKAVNRQYRLANKVTMKNYKNAHKENRNLYKSGKIDKSKYRANTRQLREQRSAYQNKSEFTMAVGHYRIKKMERANKALYIKDVKGTNSRAYKSAKRKVNRAVENYGSYRVQRTPNGSYRVTKTEVYMY